MNQLTGKVNSIVPRRGYIPILDIQLEISDSNEDEQLAFVWMVGRVAVSFLDNTSTPPQRGEAMEVGTALPRFTLPQFRKTTTTNFQLPFDERLFLDLEKTRDGRDVAVYVAINFNAIVKNLRSAPGDQDLPQGGTIGDQKYGGQEVVHVVPRSQWAEIVESLGISVSDQRKNLEEYEAQGRQALTELNMTLQAAKEAAKQVGVVEHSQVFEEEARSHKHSAYWWLAFAIIFAFSAGGVAFLNFLRAEDSVTRALSEKVAVSGNADSQSAKTADAPGSGITGLQIQLTVAKLIILSILLSASIWAGRVYKSHRHNFVINRHRSNALRTFQTFATGTSDPQIKNAVLLQATTCIFGPQNTGYISDDKEAESYPQILEIVRGAGGKEAV